MNTSMPPTDEDFPLTPVQQSKRKLQKIYTGFWLVGLALETPLVFPILTSLIFIFISRLAPGIARPKILDTIYQLLYSEYTLFILPIGGILCTIISAILWMHASTTYSHVSLPQPQNTDTAILTMMRAVLGIISVVWFVISCFAVVVIIIMLIVMSGTHG
ncbi:hypothetical protein EJ419_03980 [Alloscardovia theropitheci]|uniref:Uncharacterized protein n=1 Tax=Alloscardovia theropitheci TaxID=2496842 RepID=A0A4R0QXB8_9BIFI|nr:hypothetical protein [Alloscardovia theropitheci]TCD54210.1 hypothetical protein EJ419_03980 [Alloscardovia theropitheci]